MSVKVMSAVWDSDLSSDEKMVALALADWASDGGESIFPSRSHVAWKVGKSVRAVQYTINKLRRQGILVPVGWKTGGRGRWRIYRLDVSKLPARPAWSPQGEDVALSPREEVAPSERQSATYDTTECNLAHDRVQPVAHDPLDDPSEESLDQEEMFLRGKLNIYDLDSVLKKSRSSPAKVMKVYQSMQSELRERSRIPGG